MSFFTFFTMTLTLFIIVIVTPPQNHHHQSVLAATPQSPPFKLALLSDLHLDPFYGTPRNARGSCTSTPAPEHALGTYGCDAPAELVNSSIRSVAAQNPDLVLLSGDWLRHSAYKLSYDEARSVVTNITSMLYRSLGHGRTTVASVRPPVLDAEGNNDCWPIDYGFNLSNPTKHMLDDIADELKSKSFLSAQEAADFGHCGFFKRTVMLGSGGNSKPLDVLVLNSLLWNTELTPTPKGDDPCDQFKWIEAALKASTNPVVTVTHVPPGVVQHDATEELERNVSIDDVSYYWHNKYSVRFRDIVRANAARFRLIVFAHTHHVAFIADRYLGIPAIIVGAVSPIYFNRPNYLLFELDPDTLHVDLASLTQVGISDFSAAATWAPLSPTFRTVFGLPAAPAKVTSVNAFESYYSSMCDDKNESKVLEWFKYSAAYGKPITSCSQKCRLLASCYASHFTRNETVACYKRKCQPRSSSTGDGDAEALRITAGIVSSVILLVVLFVVFKARHPRRPSTGDLRTETDSLQPDHHQQQQDHAAAASRQSEDADDNGGVGSLGVDTGYKH